MNEKLITFGISVLTAILTALVTYFVSMRATIRNRDIELKSEQAFKYLFPLKFIADELFQRLAHIERKLVDRIDIHLQLPQTFEGKNFEWYFTDWINNKDPKVAGGYFLTTTIFMHAQLYNRINLILKEYPFLELHVNQSINDCLDAFGDEQLKRINVETLNHEHTNRWVNIQELSRSKGKMKLEKLIKNVRLAAVMKGGIPYALQSAFGQFIEKNINGKTEQITYEEFVRLLMDKEQRIKFSPLSGFYSGIVNDEFKIDDDKLVKIRALMMALFMFRNAELA